MFLAGKVSLLLLSLAAGYATLALSNKQERPLTRWAGLLGGSFCWCPLSGFFASRSVRCGAGRRLVPVPE
jgi:hypothetical protein